MARASREFEQFNMQGDAGGNMPSVPLGGGEAMAAAAQVLAGLGGTLARMADKAAARAATAAGQAVGDAAIGLPEVNFKLKPGAVDENGTGRREPQEPRRAAPQTAGDYYARLAQIESGGNPKARNAQSGAAGLYQFMPSTARQYGLDNPYDPAQAQAAVERFTADNERHLRKVLGRAPTPGELYLAHQQGAGGAAKLLANPNARAADIVGTKAVTWNGGKADMTAGDFAKQWIRKFEGGKGGATASPAALPAFTPEAPSWEMSVSVPAPKPLQLRRDGTIAGEAYDKAVTEAAAWKIQAGLDAEIGAAYDNNKDNPQAFQTAANDILKRYGETGAQLGPEMAQALQQRGVSQILTLGRDIHAKAEKRADDDRKNAADAAVKEVTSGLERQAYLAGIGEDGDRQVAALSAQANHTIDVALQSGALSPAQAVAEREKVAASVATARIQGVYDALPDVAQKKAFAESLDEAYADDTSPLSKLAPDTFRRIRDGLLTQARQETDRAGAASALEKFQLKRALDDDIASLGATGQPATLGGQPLDPQDVARVLGPDDAARWLEQREDARVFHGATATMAVQTQEQIDATLAALEPKPGEDGFARKQALFEKATKEADKLMEMRRDDPAKAAELAFPQLAGIEAPVERARARLDAQAALGIGERLRQPLTAEEARALADRIEMVEDSPDLAQTELTAIMGEAQKIYGTLADEVMAQVLEQRGIGKATAVMGLGLMQDLNIGQVPRGGPVMTFAQSRRVDQADAAMEGRPTRTPAHSARGNPFPQAPANPAAKRAKAPNAAQVNLLRKNPALAPQFDAKFGAGSADGFLKDRAPPLRRKLADGSVELTYEDGWIELLRPDGSMEGRAAP